MVRFLNAPKGQEGRGRKLRGEPGFPAKVPCYEYYQFTIYTIIIWINPTT